MFLSIIAILVLLAGPIYLLWRVVPSLLVNVSIALCRSLVQVVLVGVYVGWLYTVDSVWLDLAWLFLLAVAASFLGARREGLSLSAALMPMVSSLFGVSLLVTLYVLLLIIRPEDALTAHWFVPVAGLIIGGAQDVAISTLSSYHKLLSSQFQRYEYLLGNGATHFEAVQPLLRRAVESALQPLCRSLAMLGVVALPAAMLGMLLGGMKPMEAALLLVVLLIGMVSATLLSTALTLFLADRRAFDVYGRLRHTKTPAESNGK